jgi:hypothetical protein
MCKKCDEKIENADESELVLVLFAIIGGIVDTFVDEGYCDPTLYKGLALTELVGKKLGIPTELLDRLSVLKIQAGELVVKIAKDENLELPDELF